MKWNKNPQICVLSGLPAAGKSTIRADLIEGLNIVVASSDDIIEKFCQESGVTYSEGFETYAKRANRDMNEIIAHAFQNDLNLVWDQTNLTKNKREKTLRRIPKHYFKFVVCAICEEPIRQERLKNRAGKVIPPHVDSSMVKSMTYPTMEEGWDMVSFIRTDR